MGIVTHTCITRTRKLRQMENYFPVRLNSETLFPKYKKKEKEGKRRREKEEEGGEGRKKREGRGGRGR